MERRFFRLSISHLKACIHDGLKFVEYRDEDGGRVYAFNAADALHVQNMVGAREVVGSEAAKLKPRVTFK